MPLGRYELDDPSVVTPEEEGTRSQHAPEEFRVRTTGKTVRGIEASPVEKPPAYQCVTRVQITHIQRFARCVPTPRVEGIDVEPPASGHFEPRQDGTKRTVAGLAFDQLQIFGNPVFVRDFVVIDEQDPLARGF
jgi:hypothetical protein